MIARSIRLLFIFLLCYCTVTRAQRSITFRDDGLLFEWNVMADRAIVSDSVHHTIWTGSLLPSFWLLHAGRHQFAKSIATAFVNDSTIGIRIPGEDAASDIGRGTVNVSVADNRLSITGITVQWTKAVPKVIEMFFGCRSTIHDSVNVPSLWDRPFVPDWSAAAYCVPGAKEGPAQSYFRSWDFGQTVISLGNYGPSLGTPYGAAFPRPTLFASMGGDEGWINFGAGSIPDAAMNLKVLSTRGCLQYLYREDLWGAGGQTRHWTEPLRITIGPSAYTAIKKYFRSFPAKASVGKTLAGALFNTWGMWRHAIFNLDSIIDFAHSVNTGVIVMDDQWESAQGSGVVNEKRFPRFQSQLERIRKEKMEVGFWETVGWIADTLPHGFTRADVICDTAGRPIRTNWNFDSQGPSFYCLDISSAHARDFLRERTLREMRELKPVVLKLDFGYAMPSANMGVPRDPALRGERYAFELMTLIARAARSVDPNVVIMNYGISPLWFSVTDLVSMDDQGDLWYEMKKGHGEWSIWASLLSESGVVVSGSSSYNWGDDKEVLLNTAVLGLPGASLPIDEASSSQIGRRLAVNTWYRKEKKWTPAWFDSETGSYSAPPALRCWGRIENGQLTALAMRGSDNPSRDPLRPKGIHSTGRWAVISQTRTGIMSTDTLALIPFDKGSISIRSAKPVSVRTLSSAGSKTNTKYSWSNGEVKISVTEEQLQNIAGFLIVR